MLNTRSSEAEVREAYDNVEKGFASFENAARAGGLGDDQLRDVQTMVQQAQQTPAIVGTAVPRELPAAGATPAATPQAVPPAPLYPSPETVSSTAGPTSAPTAPVMPVATLVQSALPTQLKCYSCMELFWAPPHVKVVACPRCGTHNAKPDTDQQQI